MSRRSTLSPQLTFVYFLCCGVGQLVSALNESGGFLEYDSMPNDSMSNNGTSNNSTSFGDDSMWNDITSNDSMSDDVTSNDSTSNKNAILEDDSMPNNITSTISTSHYNTANKYMSNNNTANNSTSLEDDSLSNLIMSNDSMSNNNTSDDSTSSEVDTMSNEITSNNGTLDDSTSLGDAHTFSPVWSPQIGTMRHPKSPTTSQSVRTGDIVLTKDGRYVQAKTAINLNSTSFLHLANTSNPTASTDEKSDPLWQEIRRGTLQNPKLVSTNESIEDGDVSYDEMTQKYYIASCSTSNTMNQSDCITDELEVKSRWMGLLHETIKDRRLCDLAIPGTHDSGSWNINEYSRAVDGRVRWLFYWWPKTIIDWTVTQVVDLSTQLDAGYRELDLRIADMGEDDGGFVWWHTVSADPIEQGLQQIKDFLERNPSEVLIIDFQHFKRPMKLKPIIHQRLALLNDIILSYLKPFMVEREEVPDLPTVGEVLAVEKNIIAFMEESYLVQQSRCYWQKKMLHSSWSDMTNPESLFKHRSQALSQYKQHHADSFTDLSGAITMDKESMSIGFAEYRSFEGIFENLIDLARYGANSAGMAARNSTLYTSGASVHYRGVNDMYRHWLARPDLYKANILYVDDAVHSSTIVETAILANMHEIKREVSITFQGSTRHGFYEWREGEAVGGTDGLRCGNITGRYVIYSREYQIQETLSFDERPEIVLTEGEFPPDAEILVQVTSHSGAWQDLYFNVIDVMINNNLDLYVRGVTDAAGRGFAYISKKYNLFGETCGEAPFSGFENIVKW